MEEPGFRARGLWSKLESLGEWLTLHRKVAQYINLYNGIKPHVNTYKFMHCYKDLQGVNLYKVKLHSVYMATPYKTHIKPHVFTMCKFTTNLHGHTAITHL